MWKKCHSSQPVRSAHSVIRCSFVRDKRSIIVAALRPIWGKEGRKKEPNGDTATIKRQTDRSNQSRQFGNIETGFLRVSAKFGIGVIHFVDLIEDLLDPVM